MALSTSIPCWKVWVTRLTNLGGCLLVALSYPQCFLRSWPVLRIHSNRTTFPEVMSGEMFLENVTGDGLLVTGEDAKQSVCSSTGWTRPPCLLTMVPKLFIHLFGNHNYSLEWGWRFIFSFIFHRIIQCVFLLLHKSPFDRGHRRPFLTLLGTSPLLWCVFIYPEQHVGINCKLCCEVMLTGPKHIQ